jgi:hypothetical protein
MANAFIVESPPNILITKCVDDEKQLGLAQMANKYLIDTRNINDADFGLCHQGGKRDENIVRCFFRFGKIIGMPVLAGLHNQHVRI